MLNEIFPLGPTFYMISLNICTRYCCALFCCGCIIGHYCGHFLSILLILFVLLVFIYIINCPVFFQSWDCPCPRKIWGKLASIKHTPQQITASRMMIKRHVYYFSDFKDMRLWHNITKRKPPCIGGMELVSLSCNRVFISAESVGRGWCKIAIATKWYQFHTTDKCGFLFMPWITDQYTFVRYTTLVNKIGTAVAKVNTFSIMTT